MRILLIVLLIIASGFAGWIWGSLHPAPESVLQPIRSYLSIDDAPPYPPLNDVAAETIVSPSPETKDPTARYRAWISAARALHPYPETEEKMFKVMMCESGGQSDVINPAGPYSGLFQYRMETWSGAWNDYRDRNILDAEAQIFATALAWSLNMQSHWGCYHH
ncbi:MAG: hypothetical protein NXH72_07100 [Hyphomonadaceae bacterium]|nr:hypothetical protein [Hyphomonadaceae bacterium]